MKSAFVKKPSIILVDDHLIFRQGLKSLIDVENLGKVVGEASDGQEFMNLVTMYYSDLVIMDIDMPQMNGIEATQRAMELNPEMKIIVFSMFGDEEYYQKMIELGVSGYILKSTGINEVEKAIEVVMSGKTYFSNNLPKKHNNSTLTNKKEHNSSEKPKDPIPWW